MSIKYTYQIISVDQAARCMEVVYTSEGNQTMHIGARLPFENEPVEAVIEMYAPVRFWEEQHSPVVVPQVGLSGDVTVPDPYVPTPAETAISMRNNKLAASDWTQLPDYPMSAEEKAAWAVYRQQLRDITNQPGFPDNIIWPTEPGVLVTVL